MNAKAATCTSEGYTGDTVCAKCGKVLEKGKVIAKVDHDAGDWQSDAKEHWHVCTNEGLSLIHISRLRDAVVSLKSLLEGTSEDEVIESLRKGARKGSVFAAGRKRAGARFKK